MERRDFMKATGVTTIVSGVATVSGASGTAGNTARVNATDSSNVDDDRDHAYYVNVTRW